MITPTSLDRLLELARTAHERPLADVVDVLGQAVRATFAYRTFSISLYRPAWDDYETVLVQADEPARRAQLYTTVARTAVQAILLERAEQRAPGVFLLGGPPGGSDGRWRPGDTLLIDLRTTSGAPLALLTADDPESGRRPTPAELHTLVACAGHMALAVETAQANARQHEHTQALVELLGRASHLAGVASSVEVAEQIVITATVSLGFDRAGVLLRAEDLLHLHAAHGWHERTLATMPPLEVAEAEALLAVGETTDGCSLLSQQRLYGTPLALERPRRPGVGPLAWREQCLLVAIRDSDQRLLGLLVLDDPSDRLKPDDERCRHLALLTAQATATLETLARHPR